MIHKNLDKLEAYLINYRETKSAQEQHICLVGTIMLKQSIYFIPLQLTRQKF